METNRPIDGFEHFQETIHGIEVSFTNITSPLVAKHLAKNIGTYATIHTGRFSRIDDLRPAIECLAECLDRFLTPFKGEPILVVGVGNADLVFDALGPQVIQRIPAHMLSFAQVPCSFGSVSLFAPGTAVQNNVSTAAVISGMVQAVKPSCVLLIDAGNTSRSEDLSSVIYLSTSGLSTSGSGENLTSDALGLPVLAIAAPLVFCIPPQIVEMLHMRVNKTGVSLMGTDIPQELKAAVTIISNGIIRAVYPELDLEEWNSAQLWAGL